jgi:hypothetical protein
VLPFQPAAGAPEKAARTAPSRPAALEEEDEERLTLPPPPALPAPPAVLSGAEIEDPETHVSLPGLPAPPPMLGPLAGAIVDKAPLAAPAPVAAPADTPAPMPHTGAAPQEPPRVLSIEELATIAAELAERREPRAEVLRRHRLSEADLETHDRHWMDRIRREASRGRGELRSAHDAAYLAAVEGFRGPITANDYARVVVGLERGTANEVLDDLAIQRPALMPIVRVWTKKVAADGRLADEVGALLGTLRAA